VNRRGDKSALLGRRVEAIQKQIRNCADAIAAGQRYPSLMEKLAELEQEFAETKAKIAYSEPSAIRVRLRDRRRFVQGRLEHLQSMLAGEPQIARAEIAKHVQKITLTPEGRNIHRIRDLGYARECGCYNGAGDPTQTERHNSFTIKVAA